MNLKENRERERWEIKTQRFNMKNLWKKKKESNNHKIHFKENTKSKVLPNLKTPIPNSASHHLHMEHTWYYYKALSRPPLDTQSRRHLSLTPIDKEQEYKGETKLNQLNLLENFSLKYDF